MGNQQFLFDDAEYVLRENLPEIVGMIREELDEHRSVINENTEEIQSSFETINLLSSKIDKLSERLDQLALLVGGKKDSKKFSLSPLTSREKEVFRAIYELNEKFAFVAYNQISRKVGLTKEMVSSAVSNMISKGVPFVKRFVGKTCLLKIEESFKEAQIKGNVVGLDVPLTYWFAKQP
jgi:DNA-binding MarR family transcriptional regulator